MEVKAIRCKYCDSSNIVKRGTYKGTQYLWCKDCKHKFAFKDTLPKMQVPVNQVASAIGMYYDGLSIDKVRYQLKHIYNTDVSDFAVYNWLTRFTKDAIEITSGYKPNTGYVWLADETMISVAGKKYWLTDIIDIKTRFLIASHLAPYRRVEDIQEALKEAYNNTGVIPKVIMSDKLKAYIYAIPMTFGNEAKHLQVKKFTERPNNNIIERMQVIIKSRIKTMRGLKSLDTARTILDGFLINYNYFRPHETLSQNKPTTPSQKAGIQFPYPSWESLIKHSQIAKSQIFTKPFIPELRPIPVTKAERLRIAARKGQRDLLARIRRQRAMRTKPTVGITSIKSIRRTK